MMPRWGKEVAPLGLRRCSVGTEAVLLPVLIEPGLRHHAFTNVTAQAL